MPKLLYKKTVIFDFLRVHWGKYQHQIFNFGEFGMMIKIIKQSDFYQSIFPILSIILLY